jgi:hypothetical protein
LRIESEKLKESLLKHEIDKIIKVSKNPTLFDKVIFIPSKGILKEFNFKQIINILRSLY